MTRAKPVKLEMQRWEGQSPPHTRRDQDVGDSPLLGPHITRPKAGHKRLATFILPFLVFSFGSIAGAPIPPLAAGVHVPPLEASALVPPLAATERSVTLEQALAQALSRHPDVLSAEKEVDAARGRRLQLAAIPNPELSFQTASLPLWNSKGGEEFSLGLRELIEFPGKRALRKEIGRSEEDRARLELDRIRNVVRSRVERAYFRAAYAQKRLADLESLLQTLKEYTELATERYKNGQVPYLDIIRGRLETLRLENDLVEARRDLKSRTLVVNLLLGDSGFEPLTFTTEVSFEPLGKTWDELKATVLAGSALRLAGAWRNQAELSLALARKTPLPDFTVGLFSPSKRLGAWGFEVGLTLPIFAKEYRGAKMEARAAAEQAAIVFEGKTRRILIGLERSYEDARALEEQIGLFRDSLLREVAESLKASLNSYQYGKSDALGVLDIVRSLKETRAEFLRALLNHKLTLIDIAAAGEGEPLEAADGE